MKNWCRGVLSACTLLFSGVVGAEVPNRSGGFTHILRAVMWLDWLLLIVCVVVFLGVFGAMFYSIWSHRKSRTNKAAAFHKHVGVEIVWMLIPFLIVIALAFPAIKRVAFQQATTSPDLSIDVTGVQR